MNPRKLQLTLAIIKPHVLKNPFATRGIKEMILDGRFYIVRSKMDAMKLKDIELFYVEHKDRFFYNRLITQMMSGPSSWHILAKENAILDWRKMMGPTKVFMAQHSHPLSIRAKYGLSDTRNATHGSDSEESVRRELKILFPDFDVDEWYEEQMQHYNPKNVAFARYLFQHELKNKP